MKIQIRSFADVGNYQKERVVLNALADLDIGAHAFFVSTLTEDGKATAGRQTAFWFPDGSVRSGDLVVIYTKAGESSKKELKQGGNVHFYYWGLKESVWGGADKTGVILRIADWAHRSSTTE